METAALPPHGVPLGYVDSVDSSPRSRNTDSWDESIPPAGNASPKLRLMCSYGGHIVPRPTDKSLCYLGGDTRIVVVDRLSSLSDLHSKLSRTLLDGCSFTIKYQLPNEDLDSLISVTTDEDLDNMIEEYDRTSSNSVKSSRLRLFLFPSKPDSASSIGSLLDDSKSETWFVDALNGTGVLPRATSSDSSPNVNCLLGLDDAGDGEQQPPAPAPAKQDVHSVPDSPMLETTSSFGSTSSAPFLSNLPLIRVHVEEAGNGVRLQDPRVGLEEGFAHMNVGGAKQEEGVKEGGFVVPPPISVPSLVSPVGENPVRVLSEDEKSDHSVSGTIRKPPQPPAQSKPVDLPAHDAVARDDLATMVTCPKPVFYQDPVPVPVVNRTGSDPVPVVNRTVSDQKREAGADPNYHIPVQVKDPSYMLSMPPEQQQFIHANPHYVHHHGTGPVPVSYYPVHPMHQAQQQQTQQIDQQYPMYFIPVRQNQPAYSVSLQSNLGETPPIPSSKPTPVPNPTLNPPTAYKEPPQSVYATRTAAPPPKPELAPNLYRTPAAAAQPITNTPLIHVADQQQQYMSYHQLPHPSQTATATANYAYEYPDPLHAQIYYTQPTSTALASQYQTVSSAAFMQETSIPPTIDTKQNRT